MQGLFSAFAIPAFLPSVYEGIEMIAGKSQQKHEVQMASSKQRSTALE